MTCRGIQKFHTTQTFFISKHVYETDSVHEKDSNLQVINTLRFAWHQNICIFFFIRFFLISNAKKLFQSLCQMKDIVKKVLSYVIWKILSFKMGKNGYF